MEIEIQPSSLTRPNWQCKSINKSAPPFVYLQLSKYKSTSTKSSTSTSTKKYKVQIVQSTILRAILSQKPLDRIVQVFGIGLATYIQATSVKVL